MDHHLPARARRPRRVLGLVAGIVVGGLVLAAPAPAGATTPPSEPPGAPVDPGDLGDDPLFDGLAQACFEGDMTSCDDLYWRTPVDSTYEEYGSTCAGRVPAGTYGSCAEEVAAAVDAASAVPAAPEQPAGLGTDVALDELAQQCFDGALFACDKLYVLGGDGTDYKAYGDTCAGRQEVDSGNYCHELTGFPEPTTDIATLPEVDVALDELTANCIIADMQACDDLYRQSEAGSLHEVAGDTCAGRQVEATGVLCATAFPAWEQLLDVTTANALPATAELAAPTDPAGLGDDPVADALAAACFGGVLSSCDDLYWRSPVDSDYETYGSTCGGRLTEGVAGLCTEQGAVEPTGPVLPAATIEPTGLGTDPSLDALAADCQAGAMFACDRLYFASDDGTAYLDYGVTCAGRQAPDTGNFCHELVGFPEPTADLSDLLSEDPAVFDQAVLCALGDMQVCDDLYRSAPAESPVSPFADTCAGRQPEGTNQYCTAAFPAYEALVEVPSPAGSPTAPGATTTTVAPTPAAPGGPIPPATQPPTGLGTDPAMDAYAQGCFDGDMEACDDLYRESPLASAYETYGDTCAGRQPPASGRYCTESFPG